MRFVWWGLGVKVKFRGLEREDGVGDWEETVGAGEWQCAGERVVRGV